MGETGQARAAIGRPETKGKKVDLPLSIDVVTNTILEALSEYGRFGTSRQEVLQFILRSWLWENEDRLKAAISAARIPLGIVPVAEE